MDTISSSNVTYFTASLLINSLVFIILPVGLYKYYTRRKKVSCWFCNHHQVVNHTDITCWSCNECQQYNGFNQEGDYNISNPAFYDESLNSMRFCVSKQRPSSNSQGSSEDGGGTFNNGLCDDCNMKQKMKVKLLNEFTPFNEDNFDQEYQEYSDYVDSLYGLCSKCTSYVDTVIRKKNLQYAKVLRFSNHDQFDDGDVLDPEKYKNLNEDSKIYRIKSNSFKKSLSSYSRLRLPFKVVFFESLVIISSFTLLILNIFDLDKDCKLDLFKSVPKSVQRHISDQLKYRLQVSVLGLLSSLIATHLSGIHLLSSSDVVSSFFWMTLQLLHLDYNPNSLTSHILSKQDLFLLRPIASLMTLILSFGNIVARRSLMKCQDRKDQITSRQEENKSTSSKSTNAVSSDRRSVSKTAVIKPQPPPSSTSSHIQQDCNKELEQLLPPRIDSLQLDTGKRVVARDRINFDNENCSLMEFKEKRNRMPLIQPARFNYNQTMQMPQYLMSNGFMNGKNGFGGRYNVRHDQAVRYDAAYTTFVRNEPCSNEPSGVMFNKFSSLYLPLERQKMMETFSENESQN